MNSFSQIDLIAPIQRTLAELNYETPTPIQAQAIPAALFGQDILGCAQTGTGKTAAFSLPILNLLGENPRKAKPHQPAVLVLAPTRELAIQIGDSFEEYGRRLRLRHTLIYGGVSQFRQERALKRGVHIVIATPGRLLDLMNQRIVDLRQVEFFVLDEVDRMLDMGFLPDLKKIIAKIPKKRQSLFFSATLPPKIKELASSELQNPVEINIAPQSPTADRIEQHLFFVKQAEKQVVLRNLLASDEVGQSIVFTRTKRRADLLTDKLNKYGFRATAIHGNKTQGARQRAIGLFQRGKVDVLVATDIASRGIDIDGVSHVFNYDLPDEAEDYVHRIGRTGRAGNDGIAMTLCCDSEKRKLKSIEAVIGKRLVANKIKVNKKDDWDDSPVEESEPRKTSHQHSKPKNKFSKFKGSSYKSDKSDEGRPSKPYGKKGFGKKKRPGAAKPFSHGDQEGRKKPGVFAKRQTTNDENGGTASTEDSKPRRPFRPKEGNTKFSRKGGFKSSRRPGGQFKKRRKQSAKPMHSDRG